MENACPSHSARHPRGPNPDYSTLWAKHEPALKRLCVQLLISHDDAEDALATARVRGWAHYDRDSGSIRNPGAWLYRLTRNVCLSQLRSRGRARTLLDDVGRHDGSRSADPVEIVIANQQRDAVLRAIDGLPGRLRGPFKDVWIYGHSREEVARIYGITISAVGQRIHKALRIIRAEVTPSDQRQTRSEDPIVGMPETIRTGDDARLGVLLDEIAWRLDDSRVVQIQLPSGGTLEYHAAFDHKVARRQQRIETLTKYVTEHVRGWIRRYELANLLVVENRLAEAEVQYRHIMARQPRHLPTCLALGRLLVLAHRFRDAIEVYEQALTHVRAAAPRHHLVGLLERARAGIVFPRFCMEQRADHIQRAVEAFKAAIEAEPENLSHWHELALTHEAAGNAVEASAAYDGALLVDPSDVYALARSHNCLRLLGLHALAEARLERALEVDVNYAYAAKLLGDLRASKGQVYGREGQRTLAILRRVTERNPSSADALDALTRYHERRGEVEIVIARWRDFCERYPSNVKGWMFLACALMQGGDTEGSADAFETAHRLDPGCLDVYERGGTILIDAGRHEAARSWLSELLHRYPNHWSACIIAANALHRLGAPPDEYISMAQRAIDLQPDIAGAHRELARLLCNAGRYAEALEALNRSIQISGVQSSAPNLFALLGRLKPLRALGRDDEAEEELRVFEDALAATELWEPERQVWMARAKLAFDDWTGAERLLQEAAKHAAWITVDAYAELRRGRLAAAAADLSHTPDEGTKASVTKIT